MSQDVGDRSPSWGKKKPIKWLSTSLRDLISTAPKKTLSSGSLENPALAASDLEEKIAPIDLSTLEHNEHPDFVGVDAMKELLRRHPGPGFGCLSKLEDAARQKRWSAFHPSGLQFDWWMFPIPEPSNTFGHKYQVKAAEIALLKSDSSWLCDYRRGFQLIAQSWGWDIEKRDEIPQCSEHQRWIRYPARLKKMFRSLVAFEQVDYIESLSIFAELNLDAKDLESMKNFLIRH
jgi:hypothetical protein